ncbi:hypothetical protein ACWD0J_37635 [Streptomyces sp. NPDC003011]
MHHHRRSRVVCSAGALLTGIGAARCAGGPHGRAAAVLVLVTLGLVAAAVRASRTHAQLVRAHRLARHLALGAAPRWPAPEPCCDFWRVRDDAGHLPDCRHADGPAAEVARGWRELDAACCLRGWESRGAVHDAGACVSRTAA